MLVAAVAALFGCLLIERRFPGWRQPRVPTWYARAIAVNLAQLAVVLIAGATWERWLASMSIFGIGARMPAWAGGLLAYFLATFVFYWWHRWRHESDWLWRHLHQIHHSAQRLEALTSFYKHPLEMVANSLIGSVLVYSVLGVTVDAAAVYTLCTALGEFFYHTNWRTPHWIGYVFQRPEMHRIHHQRDWHRSNYADIVWWDMLFGTYENPRMWEGMCGFASAREQQLGAMLAFRDVDRGWDTE
jgi:sterol desaturase/sphingolipid hydroxylase (fatty acid hydroxylase superfamily)